MPKTIQMIFRLWKQQAKMDLLWMLRDLRYFLIQVFSDTVGALASVSAVLLLSRRFGGLGGFTFDEMLFLCGYALLTDGILLLFFGGSNVAYISRIIGRGQLDHMLIQPVPLWVQMITGGFIPFSGSSKFIYGAVMTAAAVSRLALPVTPLWLLALIGSLLLSTAVILSVVFVFSCGAFYAPVAAEEIAMKIHELFAETKNYPLAGFSARGALAFCTVVPVGLAAWAPSGFLLESPVGVSSAIAFAAALIWFAAAALIFRKGLHHYEKYGSNRYTGFGHR